MMSQNMKELAVYSSALLFQLVICFFLENAKRKQGKVMFGQAFSMADNYVVTTNNISFIEFACLPNYHLVFGDLVSHCQNNGTWSGIEPHCEVDFYKEKVLLSTFIAITTALIFTIYLTIDYYFYVNRRVRQKEEKTRYEVCHQRRKTLLDNRRCMPNFVEVPTPKIPTLDPGAEAIIALTARKKITGKEVASESLRGSTGSTYSKLQTVSFYDTDIPEFGGAKRPSNLQARQSSAPHDSPSPGLKVRRETTMYKMFQNQRQKASAASATSNN